MSRLIFYIIVCITASQILHAGETELDMFARFLKSHGAICDTKTNRIIVDPQKTADCDAPVSYNRYCYTNIICDKGPECRVVRTTGVFDGKKKEKTYTIKQSKAIKALKCIKGSLQN